MRLVCRHVLLTGEAAILGGRSLTAGGRDYNTSMIILGQLPAALHEVGIIHKT